jgi:hypothetical protein
MRQFIEAGLVLHNLIRGLNSGTRATVSMLHTR